MPCPWRIKIGKWTIKIDIEKKNPITQREELNRTFHRLSTSLIDLKEVRQYLSFPQEEMDEVLRRAVFSAAIVAYSRPFLDSRGGKERLASSKLGKRFWAFLSEKQRTLHEKIVNIRNKAVAHSDFEFRRSERILPTYRDPRISPGVMTVTTVFDPLAHGIDILEFSELEQCLTSHWSTMKLDIGLQLNKGDGPLQNPAEPSTYSAQRDEVMSLQIPLDKFLNKTD